MSRRARGSAHATARAGATKGVAATGRKKRGLAAIVLFLATLAIFLPTLQNGFVSYDDPANVYNSSEVTRGLSRQGITWAFTHEILGHWDPLTTLSHMLDCSLFGLHPWGHHLTNACLHAAAAALFFLALEAMTGTFSPALFAAALFAWHPLRVESVAWISERKDVLCAFFFMGALWAYAGYARRPSPWRFGAVAALFAGSLLSKSMAVTFPCVLLLLDGWPLGRFRGQIPPWKLLLEKIPLVLLSIAAAGVQLFATSGFEVRIPFSERIATATVGYLLYLSKWLWPSALCVLYPRPAAWPWWEIALSGAVLAGISIVAVMGRRTAPYLLTGWLWFLGMLTPVIGIIQIGMQSIADRYSYLPSAGLAVIAAWGALDLTRGWRGRTAALAAAGSISLAVCAALTIRQIGFWRDGEAIYRRALEVAPRNLVAHVGLGAELLSHGRAPEAIDQLQAALTLNPNDLRAHLNLGAGLMLTGRIPEAITHYRAAEELQPGLAFTHVRLGELLLRSGQPDEAAQELRAGLAIEPNHEKGRLALALLLRQQGRLDEAAAEYERLLAASPTSFEAHNELGALLYQRGKLDEAGREFRAAIQADPNRADGHFNLGMTAENLGALDEAIREYQEAGRLQPGAEAVRMRLGLLLEKKKAEGK